VAATSCPLGKGSASAECSTSAPLLLDAVDAAIEAVAQRTPGILDVNDQATPNSGQYRILDRKAFIDAMIATLQGTGYCAQADYDHPLDRINLKSSNDVSETFAIVLSSGYVRRGPRSYLQSCTPAAFPIDPDPSWPPSGSGCTQPYPPPITRFNAKVHLQAPDFVTLDSTALVGPDVAYCTEIGYTDGRALCPVRIEGDPERKPCEEWAVGKARDTGRYGPTWTLDSQYCRGLAVNGCANHPDNQYALLASKGGSYVVCAQNGACGQVYVDR
jgi:hypothetical protein